MPGEVSSVERSAARERVGVEILPPSPIGPATLEAQDDFVPLRQVVLGIGQAELFGKMDGLVDDIPAVRRRQAFQDLQVEERDAGGRTERVGAIVRRFLHGIEQHRLDAHLLFVAEMHRSQADGVAQVERELAALASAPSEPFS